METTKHNRINLPSIRRAALKALKSNKWASGYRTGTPPLVAAFECRLREISTRSQWEALEDAGLVRLDIVPDYDIDLDNILGTCYDIDSVGRFDGGKRRLDKQREMEIDRINREGVWGVVGQYRLYDNDQWENANSCSGFVGSEWKDSGCDMDIMAETVEALRDALKSRYCPRCGLRRPPAR